MALVSRTANSFQAPLLAKFVEQHIYNGTTSSLAQFRFILLSTSIGTLIGIILLPTFQRLMSKAVNRFSVEKSIPRLLFYSFSKAGIAQFKNQVAIPTRSSLQLQDSFRLYPKRIILLNLFSVTILTTGVLSAIYAGFFAPEFRTTAANLSPVVNGLATILLFVFVDPYFSVLTDEVVEGKFDAERFRQFIIISVFVRLGGTLLSQLLLLPFARLIARVAASNWI